MATGQKWSLYDSDHLRLGPGQIRLLSVLSSPSSSNNTLIQCSLKVVNLDHRPEYYALSYTWGAPTEYGRLSRMSADRDCPILCNKELLGVTKNLHCFLRQLQYLPTLSDKIFWIDAICVNQQDNEERHRQVRLMADIYSAAALVISWLGEQDDHTEPGFALLKELKIVSDRSRHLLAKLSPDSRDYGEQLAVFSNRQSWVSVAHVFQRTYFTRVWIVQEVVLAKAVKVLCGDHELDWSAIAEASHFFTTSGWRGHLYGLFIESVGWPLTPQEPILKFRYQAPTTLRSIAKKCNERKQQEYQHENRHEWATTLLHTLIQARNFKATDPRDKVYSLLGLVHEYARDKLGLIPSYTQAPADAYTRAAIQILEDSDDLLLLSCVEGEKFQRKDTRPLPSWVPDWSSEEPTGLRRTGYERYLASGSLKQRPNIDRRTLTLSLKGLRLDHLTMVGETKQDVQRGEPFPKWLEILESLETRYGRARAEHKLDVFWRTLIVNTAGYPPQLVPNTRSLGASFAEWFGAWRHGRPTPPGRPEDEWDCRANRFSELLDAMWDPQSRNAANPSEFKTPFSMTEHLRLFRTREGYLGLGSECVQVGDSVWVVPGSRVPLILRAPKGDRFPENRYQLVSGAYLHGFMEGEAVSPLVTGMTLEEIEGLMETFMLE
ncbi:hypothetical protein DL771_010254 [Monosporascus sp. 5C6A]|nr:hypothetical protein DL771_010254 [Monosporascus sp. 5C6A]